MRAFVFTDPALTSRAGQFVWLELNVDEEKNAAHRERLSLDALPTFYVLNPADETVVMQRVDGMTVAEMGAFLDEARAAATGAPPSSPVEAALLRADRRSGEGKDAAAAAAYREALPAPGCSGSPASVMVARSGLDCALGLGKEDAGRSAAIIEMETATRRTLADSSLGAAADDVSTSYLSLMQARQDAGDTAGARRDAEAWAAFLEAQAAAAQTPEQRAVFDSHRLSAYLELQQPERAIPMLQASETDLPGDYNPPSRLAVAYLAMKKPDEALAASNRALPKVSGPRRIRVLQTRSEIFAAKGAAAAAREALEQALKYAESLPAGQRSEGTIKALQKKLEAPPAKPPADESSRRPPMRSPCPCCSSLPSRLSAVRWRGRACAGRSAASRDDRPVRAGGHRRRCHRPRRERAPRAREDDRGGAGHRRASSCARSGPATRRSSSSCWPTAPRLGQARLHYFLVNKGPWYRARPRRAVPPRRPGRSPRAAASTRPAPPRPRSRPG